MGAAARVGALAGACMQGASCARPCLAPCHCRRGKRAWMQRARPGARHLHVYASAAS